MKKKYNVLLVGLIVIVLLTSCWDRRLLKDHSLIMAIGYDLNEDGTISKTVTFPRETIVNIGQSSDSEATESHTITTTGPTVGASDLDLERYLSQRFDRSKARILLLGEDLARDGIYAALDSMYRDPRGPLSALVAVVSGRAEQGLTMENQQSFFVSEFYYNLLKSSEESGIIVCENIQSICPVILSRRKDIALPFISAEHETNEINISGLALFTGEKMTGTLNLEESIMYLILTDNISKKAKFNLKISDDQQDNQKNYATIAIRNEKRKIDVKPNPVQPVVNLHLTLQIEIEEFAKNHLYRKGAIGKLEKQVSKQLMELAHQTLDKMKEANNDSLGIGEKIRAYHYKVWEKVDWNELYPKTVFHIDFDVEIVQHGVIN